MYTQSLKLICKYIICKKNRYATFRSKILLAQKHRQVKHQLLFQKTLLAILLIVVLLDIGWIFAGVAGATTLDPDLATAQTYCNIIYIIFNIFQVRIVMLYQLTV